MKKILLLIISFLLLSGCKLSGRVLTIGGEPIEGVTIILSGSASGQAITNSNGEYEFEVPNKKGNYSIKPSMNNASSFAPMSRDIVINSSTEGDVEGIDFVAGPKIIAGSITNKGEPVSGINVVLEGDAVLSTTTNENGQYSFYVDNGNYVIRPNNENIVFIPSTDSITVSNDNNYSLYIADFKTEEAFWTQYYFDSFTETQVVVPTHDSGYIAVLKRSYYSGGHYTYKAILIKIDANGNKQWEKWYDDDLGKYQYEIMQEKDNGYIFMKPNGARYTLVYKIDEQGDDVWQSNVGGIYNDICILRDGGYAVVGSEFANGRNANPQIVKLNNTGIVEWIKSFPEENNEFEIVCEASDRGFLLVKNGTMHYLDDNNTSLLKIDALGNEQWRKTFDNGVDYLTSLRLTNDGGYILSGTIINSITSMPNDSLVVMKTDSNLNIEWQKIFEEKIETPFYSDAIQGADNNYIIGGTYLVSASPGPLLESWITKSGLWLIKVDSKGETIWNKVFDMHGVGSTRLNSIEATNGGGWILGVYDQSNDYQYAKAIIVKTDSNGNIDLPK